MLTSMASNAAQRYAREEHERRVQWIGAALAEEFENSVDAVERLDRDTVLRLMIDTYKIGQHSLSARGEVPVLHLEPDTTRTCRPGFTASKVTDESGRVYARVVIVGADRLDEPGAHYYQPEIDIWNTSNTRRIGSPLTFLSKEDLLNWVRKQIADHELQPLAVGAHQVYLAHALGYFPGQLGVLVHGPVDPGLLGGVAVRALALDERRV